MSLSALREKIASKTAKVGVVACLFADAGFDVVGVDVKAERVARINAGP